MEQGGGGFGNFETLLWKWKGGIVETAGRKSYRFGIFRQLLGNDTLLFTTLKSPYSDPHMRRGASVPKILGQGLNLTLQTRRHLPEDNRLIFFYTSEFCPPMWSAEYTLLFLGASFPLFSKYPINCGPLIFEHLTDDF